MTMRPETAFGYVYLIRKGDTDFYKIGSARHPQRRLKALQTGNPVVLSLVGAWYVASPYVVEKSLHRLLLLAWEQREWFRLSAEQVAMVSAFLHEHVRQRPAATLTVPLLLLLGLLLTGCEAYTREVARIVGYRGPDLYDYPCAPESLQAGHCVPPQSGGLPR
jgi:hypothetical protein